MRLGVDLGGTKTEAVVLDPQGIALQTLRRPTPVHRGYDAILDTVCGLVTDLERDFGRCSIGMGTPGTLARNGRLKNSNTVCLNGQPIQQDVAQRLGRPIRLANDANCFALSEARDGAGQGHAVVFGIILGTGVGGGLVVHGRLIEGLHAIAGEWGHNPLEPDGPPCYCGRRGCVETLLSGPGLRADYQRHGGSSDPDVAQIAARAAAGERAAQEALDRHSARLGRALATVINIIDPDVVVVGGGLSHLAHMYSAVPVALAQHVFNDECRTPIVPNRHGDSSGVRGAACLWPA